jgi:hypothetical protein
LVTRVVVVVGVLSLLVSLIASPPTVTAASVAAIPKISAGRRYQGNTGATTPVSLASNSTIGRAPVAGVAPYSGRGE